MLIYKYNEQCTNDIHVLGQLITQTHGHNKWQCCETSLKLLTNNNNDNNNKHGLKVATSMNGLRIFCLCYYQMKIGGFFSSMCIFELQNLVGVLGL